MQPVAIQPDRNADIATNVVTAMRQLGVLGLPRNYEIFYEALNGTNRELSLAVVSLSNRPTQEDLDKIGRTFFA
ncbi:MAG: GGDEF domain-containing protein, partial [Mesorhizobium sp.]